MNQIKFQRWSEVRATGCYLFKPLIMYILFSNGHLVCSKAKCNSYFFIGKLEYRLDESSVGGINF